ncbi:hypothetical protein GIB67_030224 [Kingdonia uniflora]|uniref:Uncharacterized protein n=1 Tax=Kingdonia uniflora TaxID=39325 RepID=A0A7J7MMX8_9MAGN|nr:hypothetical protein GIB67_030224 [Kingdonia uniflora]
MSSAEEEYDETDDELEFESDEDEGYVSQMCLIWELEELDSTKAVESNCYPRQKGPMIDFDSAILGHLYYCLDQASKLEVKYIDDLSQLIEYQCYEYCQIGYHILIDNRRKLIGNKDALEREVIIAGNISRKRVPMQSPFGGYDSDVVYSLRAAGWIETQHYIVGYHVDYDAYWRHVSHGTLMLDITRCGKIDIPGLDALTAEVIFLHVEFSTGDFSTQDTQIPSPQLGDYPGWIMEFGSPHGTTWHTIPSIATTSTGINVVDWEDDEVFDVLIESSSEEEEEEDIDESSTDYSDDDVINAIKMEILSNQAEIDELQEVESSGNRIDGYSINGESQALYGHSISGNFQALMAWFSRGYEYNTNPTITTPVSSDLNEIRNLILGTVLKNKSEYMHIPLEFESVIVNLRLMASVELSAVQDPAQNRLTTPVDEHKATSAFTTRLLHNRGMWKSVDGVRKDKKDEGLKKESGCSWIEIGSTVTGTRYGASLRKQIKKMEYAVKRKAVGIWGCKDCGEVKGGGVCTSKQ